LKIDIDEIDFAEKLETFEKHVIEMFGILKVSEIVTIVKMAKIKYDASMNNISIRVNKDED
jgi:hypothetical protein